MARLVKVPSQHEDLSPEPWGPHQKLGVALYTCNPSAMTVGTGGSLGVAGHSVQSMSELQSQ